MKNKVWERKKLEIFIICSFGIEEKLTKKLKTIVDEKLQKRFHVVFVNEHVPAKIRRTIP